MKFIARSFNTHEIQAMLFLGTYMYDIGSHPNLQVIHQP
jgi:hypothetical protein